MDHPGMVNGTRPGAKWWETMVAVGPQMEFHLGAHGFLGGGGIHVRVPDEHFFTASGHFFGRAPYVISWGGVVTKEVERLEVVLEDGRTKEVPLHDGPADIGRFFWLFPPRGVRATIVAHGRCDRVLERKPLPEVEVTPEQNAGTSVNPRDGGPTDHRRDGLTMRGSSPREKGPAERTTSCRT